MNVFRGEVFAINWDFTLTQTMHTRIIEHLREIVVNVLKGISIQGLRDIVDFMRKYEE